MIHFSAVKPETEIIMGTILYARSDKLQESCLCVVTRRAERVNVFDLCVVQRLVFHLYQSSEIRSPKWPGLDGIHVLLFEFVFFCSLICTKCLVPGLAALWGARVRWGVFIAGSLHAWSFTLELFTGWRQWLIYCTQNVRRLGLEEQEIMGFSVWHMFYQGEMRLNNDITISGDLRKLTFPGVKNDFISGGR